MVRVNEEAVKAVKQQKNKKKTKDQEEENRIRKKTNYKMNLDNYWIGRRDEDKE